MLARKTELSCYLLSVQLITYQFNLLIWFRFTNESEKKALVPFKSTIPST